MPRLPVQHQGELQRAHPRPLYARHAAQLSSRQCSRNAGRRTHLHQLLLVVANHSIHIGVVGAQAVHRLLLCIVAALHLHSTHGVGAGRRSLHAQARSDESRQECSDKRSDSQGAALLCSSAHQAVHNLRWRGLEGEMVDLTGLCSSAPSQMSKWKNKAAAACRGRGAEESKCCATLHRCTTRASTPAA